MGQRGAQAITDHLKRLEANNQSTDGKPWKFPLQHWKATRSYAAKRALAIKIAMDRSGPTEEIACFFLFVFSYF